MSQIMGRPVPQIPASPSSASPEQQCLVLQEIEHRQIAMLPVSIDLALFTGIALIMLRLILLHPLLPSHLQSNYTRFNTHVCYPCTGICCRQRLCPGLDPAWGSFH